MDFLPTEDQEALRAGVREICTDAFPRDRLGELADRPAQASTRRCGTPSKSSASSDSCLPEADGGLGLALGDAVLVFEELGRALVPGPARRHPARRRPAGRRNRCPCQSSRPLRRGARPHLPRRAPWRHHQARRARRRRRAHRRRPGAFGRHRRRPDRPAHPARRHSAAARRTPLEGGAARGGRKAPCSRRRSRPAWPWRRATSPCSTPKNASSSAARSARSRRSSTCARTCTCAPRSPPSPCTRPP